MKSLHFSASPNQSYVSCLSPFISFILPQNEPDVKGAERFLGGTGLERQWQVKGAQHSAEVRLNRMQDFFKFPALLLCLKHCSLLPALCPPGMPVKMRCSVAELGEKNKYV